MSLPFSIPQSSGLALNCDFEKEHFSILQVWARVRSFLSLALAIAVPPCLRGDLSFELKEPALVGGRTQVTISSSCGESRSIPRASILNSIQ